MVRTLAFNKMPYQSIRTSQTQDNTLIKWLLIAAGCLSVVTLIVLKTLVWLAPPPAQEPPRSEPAVTAASLVATSRSQETEEPDINPATLSNGHPLSPPAIQINPPESADSKNHGLLEISPQSLASPGAIETFLSQLKVAAITDNKAIINGLLFEADDFIDTGKQLKLVSQNQGKLVFEVNGVPYTYKLKY